MEKRSFVLLMVFVVLLVTVLVGCGGKVTPTVTPEPEITVKPEYHFEKVPREVRRALPEFPEKIPAVLISLRPYGSHSKKVLAYRLRTMPIFAPGGVELFETAIDFSSDKEVGADCRWYGRVVYDGAWTGGLLLGSCSDEISMPVEVRMAFCEAAQGEGGIYCRRDGLRVLIEPESISFTDTGSFEPAHRQWLEEILAYKGWKVSLPSTLSPGTNYLIRKPADPLKK